MALSLLSPESLRQLALVEQDEQDMAAIAHRFSGPSQRSLAAVQKKIDDARQETQANFEKNKAAIKELFTSFKEKFSASLRQTEANLKAAEEVISRLERDLPSIEALEKQIRAEMKTCMPRLETLRANSQAKLPSPRVRVANLAQNESTLKATVAKLEGEIKALQDLIKYRNDEWQKQNFQSLLDQRICHYRNNVEGHAVDHVRGQSSGISDESALWDLQRIQDDENHIRQYHRDPHHLNSELYQIGARRVAVLRAVYLAQTARFLQDYLKQAAKDIV